MEKNNLLIPASIIIAGIIIAGAFFISKNEGVGGNNGDINDKTKTEINIKAVTTDEHILGNPDADLVIVEFSDLECPFCKNFHETMTKVMDEYGKSGKVAWVYRHFPLTQIHPKAPKEAEATECAWDQGGNDAFWKYTNKIFEETPSNNGLNLDLLPEFAEEIGLNRVQFEECLESSKFKNKVNAHTEDAIASGAQGTPYSVFLLKGEEPIPVSGGLPYDQLKPIIDQVLQSI